MQRARGSPLVFKNRTENARKRLVIMLLPASMSASGVGGGAAGGAMPKQQQMHRRSLVAASARTASAPRFPRSRAQERGPTPPAGRTWSGSAQRAWSRRSGRGSIGSLFFQWPSLFSSSRSRCSEACSVMFEPTEPISLNFRCAWSSQRWKAKLSSRR